MHHVNMRLLFSLCFVLGATGFSLFDRQTSYVEFERLRANQTDGMFGVSLRCKTYIKTGLLLYVDDLGNGEYFTLYLQDGFLLLELNDGSGKFLVKSKIIINDFQWHGVEVELNSHHAVYRLDNKTQAEFNITKMQLQSNLYIGGFPNDIDVFSLSGDEMAFIQHFLGCVENVEFFSNVGNATQTRATKVLRSAGMNSECKDACKPKNPCQNDGVCLNKFAVAECLCAETGFGGRFCEKESPVVGTSHDAPHVIFDVVSSYVAASSETTSLFVRVRSTQQDGVFFYTVYSGDYILLELTNGRIAASVNLGSGSVTITTKKNTYSDNQWHRVKLERVKRLVNLTVDNSDTSKGKTKGDFDKFHLPNKKTSFVLGGLVDDKKTKLKSLSRKNFTGCLQELTFNGYDLFGQFNKSAKGVSSRGKFLKTCLKTPTKPPKVLTTFSAIQTTASDPQYNTSTPGFGTSKTTTTNQNLPCTLAGTSCETTTTGVPTLQTHVVTSTQVESVTTADTLSSTSEKRVTNEQSKTNSKIFIQSTIGPKSAEVTPSTKTIISENFSSNKDVKMTTSGPFSKDDKVAEDTSMSPTTEPGGVIMESRNERNEGDLTVYFIAAAVVGLLAFLLAILIIVKINWASKKKYAVRGKKYERDYWADTGSFQRANRESKPLV